MSTQGRIVVGVDGSEGSKHALRWAAKQAGYTGATLEVVAAWDYPATYGWVPVPPEDYALADFAEKSLNDAINEVFGADVPANLQRRVVEGHPAQVLVDASRDAELLVVGSRGYGGFADALLGSVSTYCVHHAHGAVTVIRPS
ncbi:MAG TPA: universal stress protein [Streptosporangiaceae bacterium]|nr:universal stress protein [Streptosporangiaceae bacterium]